MAMPAPTLEIYSYYTSSWLNVSSYLVMRNGISVKRGRASQFDTSSPGTMSFTLTSNSPYGVPGASYFQINNAVRLTISGYQVWYGLIDSMTTSLGPGYNQTVSFTCTDIFKRYARRRLSSYGVEESHQLIGAYSAGATYALDAPRNGVGSFWEAFRDSTASPIRIYGGSAGSHEFADDGPPFATSCITFNPDANFIGPVLEHPTSWNPGTENAVVSFWFKTTDLEPANDSYLVDMRRTSGGTGYFSVTLEASTGKIKLTGAGDSAGNINHSSTKTKLWDKNWHHVAIRSRAIAQTLLDIYIDGVLDSSHTATGLCAISATNRRITFGGLRNSSWTDNSYCLPGSMAVIGLYKYTGTPSLTSIYNACTKGDVGDTISTRLTSLSGFLGEATPTVTNASGRTLSGQDTKGKTYLECVQEIAETERGVFYMDRLNGPKFRGSGARTSGASVTLTLDATKDIVGDFAITSDDSLFANVVTATGPVGSYTAIDSTSITTYGEINDQFTSLAGTETYLQNSVTERLSDRSYTGARLSKITIDLLTTPNSIAATTVQLVPLDRVSVTGLDLIYAGVTSFDGFVEGWELSITDQSYTCSLDLSPVI
jgi:hypothetical protein